MIMKRFDPRNVLTICEDIGRYNWALRAFGALLESANLERLFCKNEKAEAYRAGLNLLIYNFCRSPGGPIESSVKVG